MHTSLNGHFFNLLVTTVSWWLKYWVTTCVKSRSQWRLISLPWQWKVRFRLARGLLTTWYAESFEPCFLVLHIDCWSPGVALLGLSFRRTCEFIANIAIAANCSYIVYHILSKLAVSLNVKISHPSLNKGTIKTLT